jgi:hypothetical protein
VLCHVAPIECGVGLSIAVYGETLNPIWDYVSHEVFVKVQCHFELASWDRFCPNPEGGCPLTGAVFDELRPEHFATRDAEAACPATAAGGALVEIAIADRDNGRGKQNLYCTAIAFISAADEFRSEKLEMIAFCGFLTLTFRF